ncbi:AtpZ/AtpI family protein [Candidatus Saccharibacteria bacterium]|nr:AtpZ/AtpI family protein [Candidatus Saccharibacteria bacterium]
MSADKKSSQPKSSTENQALIVGTFLDTTWRMFIPILIFSLLGYAVDMSLSTKPVATISGICIGSLSSLLLVRQLYKKVKGTNKE